MKKGIDDQLASGGETSRTSIRSVQDLQALFQGLGAPLPNGQRPTARRQIVVSGRQGIDIIGDGWSAILETNQPPSIFGAFGGVATLASKQVIMGWPSQYVIELMNADQIYGRLLRAANWVKRMDSGETPPARPPRDCGRDMLVYPDPRLPRLESIITSPRYSANGTLIQAPGYHPNEALFFDPKGELRFDSVPSTPSVYDVETAKQIIFEVFHDFPFASRSDQVHAMAKPLVIIGRRLIQGPVPLQLTEAKVPGTGKGLLEDILSIITLGRAVEVVTLPTREEEIKKLITSLLLTSPEAVMLDNADDKHVVHSPSLAAVLTSEIWKDRLLGASQTIALPNLASWSLTGNNVRLSSELARRCVRSRMDSKMDQPWLRRDSQFKHPRLKEYVRQNRAKLFRAYVVLIENWKAQGQPRSSRRLGSYEAYSEFVGGVLESAGIDGFLGNLQDFYATADVEGQSWREFTTAWWNQFKAAGVSVTDLNKLCDGGNYLVAVRGDGNFRSQQTRLGLALKERVGRGYGPYGIIGGEENGHKGRKYRLELTAINAGDLGNHGDLLGSSTKYEDIAREELIPELNCDAEGSQEVPKI